MILKRSNQKEVKIYNIFFPIWMLIVFPITWIITLPINYIIDSIVVLGVFKILKVDNIIGKYKKCIGWVWWFGFLADFVGAGLLMGISSLDKYLKIDYIWWYDNIYYPIAYSPFSSIWSIGIVSFSIGIAAIVIYFLNIKFAFKNLRLTITEKRKTALALAIITAPYLFFLPLELFV